MLLFLLLLSALWACKILIAPHPGIELYSWQWKHGALITGPPANSRLLLVFFKVKISLSLLQLCPLDLTVHAYPLCDKLALQMFEEIKSLQDPQAALSYSCNWFSQDAILKTFLVPSLVYQNLGLQIKSRFWVRFNQYRVYWEESFEKSDICVSVFPVSSIEPNRYKVGVYWIFEDISEWMRHLILFMTIVTILLDRLCFLCCSVAKSCQTLCNPMDCSMPGLPVPHHFLEFAQVHVHCISDAVQPSHPLTSPFPPTLNLSQHLGLFQWAGSSHQVAKVLELHLQHQSFQ